MLSAELPSPDFKSAAEGRMTGDGPVARGFANGHQAGFEAPPCSTNNRRMRDRCARVQATYDNPAEYQPRIDAAIQGLADEIEKILHPPSDTNVWRSPGERKEK